MENREEKKKNVMCQIASGIVRWRLVILLLFLIAAVYCALSVGKVRVNSDLTVFLADNTETRQGLTIMEDDFVTFASEDLMIANVTFERAAQLAEEIRSFDHVFSVSFDDSPAHYAKSSALFSIAYDGVEGSDGVEKAQAEIRSLLEPYDIYAYSMDLKSYSRQLAEEMVGVIAIAAVVIVLILLFTSRSYFEVIIFMIVFVFAALLNMGTNFWLGEISTITNSIAVIRMSAFSLKLQEKRWSKPYPNLSLKSALPA